MATDPAHDPASGPDREPGRRAERLAWLAGAACVACYALPMLVAAGLLGDGALAVAARLPTVAAILAAARPCCSGGRGGASLLPRRRARLRRQRVRLRHGHRTPDGAIDVLLPSRP